MARMREKESMQTQTDLSTYAPPALTYLGTIESLTAGSGSDSVDDGGMGITGSACPCP
jgi:hypothetical protein